MVRHTLAHETLPMRWPWRKPQQLAIDLLRIDEQLLRGHATPSPEGGKKVTYSVSWQGETGYRFGGAVGSSRRTRRGKLSSGFGVWSQRRGSRSVRHRRWSGPPRVRAAPGLDESGGKEAASPLRE